MANFGESFSSGFSSGAAVGQRNRLLGQQDRQLEQTQQQAQREQLQGQLDVVNQTLDAFRSTVTEAAKNVGPERAKQFLSDPRFQAQIAQAVEVRNAFMSQLGFSGGASANAEDVIAQMTRLADTQPSAADKGIRAGEEAVAQADVISGAVGGSPEERQRNFAGQLGVEGPEAKSAIGKLRQDLGNGFITEEEFAGLVAQGDPDLSKQQFKEANDLRDEFVKQSGVFVDVRDSYGRVLAAAEDPSAAGDLALIFNYMKVLDPGSTVREGEFATAQNAANVPDRIRAQFNQILRGERMVPEQRADFVDRAGRLFEGQEKFHNKLKGQYTRLAQDFGVPPERVVLDLSGDFPERQEIPTINAQADFDALPSGTVYRNPDDGELYEKQ